MRFMTLAIPSTMAAALVLAVAGLAGALPPANDPPKPAIEPAAMSALQTMGAEFPGGCEPRSRTTGAGRRDAKHCRARRCAAHIARLVSPSRSDGASELRIARVAAVAAALALSTTILSCILSMR